VLVRTPPLPPTARRGPPPDPLFSDPGAASLRFTDAQEQASALHGWNQDYLQLSAGTFQGALSEVQGPGIRLFVEQVQQSVLQTGALDPHVLAVGTALHASGDGLFCGAACSADSLHVFSGRSGFEFRPSAVHTMLGIELRLDLAAPDMACQTGAKRDDDAPLPSQPCVLQPTPEALTELRRYLLELFVQARSQPRLLARPAITAAVTDYVIDHVAQCLPAPVPPGSRDRHWSLVRQANALVQAGADQPPTVARLCAELGVSRRTLQSGFRQVLGISPLAYLKAVRLHQARRALKHCGSVTEAATSCGFWHFGHFSQDYQVFFGEKPSETLRRHHGA
jgi:AraC family transcriptional regulator, ethanolamine operon transcriptional activator